MSGARRSMIWLRRVLGVTGWAAFGLLYWAFAAPWFEEGWDPKTYDWTSDWTPAEPGEAFSVYDGLVTEILFSARDIKFYAYRWGPGHEFHILVQRPGRDQIDPQAYSIRKSWKSALKLVRFFAVRAAWALPRTASRIFLPRSKRASPLLIVGLPCRSSACSEALDPDAPLRDAVAFDLDAPHDRAAADPHR